MARKQHLINVHTSTGTTAPTGASLYLGEIAVQHTPNDPALWIKVGSSQSSEEYEKFIGETEIAGLIEDSKILGSGYTYSGIPYVNSSTSIADAYSALTKETVDLTDRVAENEYVFAIALNDLDDRIEEISGNTGAGAEPLSAAVISLSASVVSEAADITALSSATESHVTDTDIHVTSADKTAWNGKQDAISDLSAIRNNALSGASAYTDVRALSSATATHIADNGKHLPAVTSSDNGKVLQVDDGDWSPVMPTIVYAGESEPDNSLGGEGDVYLQTNSGITEELEELSGMVVTIDYVVAHAINNLNDRIDEISGNTGAGAEPLSAAVISLSASVVSDRSSVSSLSASVVTNKNNVSSLSASVVTNKNSVTALSASVVTNKNNVSALSASVVTNKNGVTALSASVVTNKDNVSSLSASVVTNKNDVTALSASVVTNQSNITSLSASVVDNKNKVSAVTISLEELSGIVEDNEYVVAQAFNDVNDRLDAIEGNSGLTELSASVISNRSDMVALSASVIDNKNEISAVTVDLVALSGIVESAITSIDTIDEVTAAALVDLDGRVGGLSDSVTALSGSVASINHMEETTWTALKTMRDGGTLTPGMWYRITDYNTTTVQEDTQAAGHQFDVIVLATDVNKLSEEARAIRHSGDTYFSASTLEGWKIWYCLDNDMTRFAWADSGSTGRGVIYKMIDEWNNDCPYDFKNIQFARWEQTNPVGYIFDEDEWDYVEDSDQSWVSDYNFKAGFYSTDGSSNDISLLYDEDFGDYKKKISYTVSSTPTYCYTFGRGLDTSLGKKVYGNVIREYYISNKLQLNNIVFLQTASIQNCYHNTFGNNCRVNTFGVECHSNTFRDECYSNTFRDYCYFNTFGNNCYFNTFGDGCYSNAFGNDCNYNTFGNYCSSNTFGDGCYSNAFGNNCYSNTFGNNCHSNAFGNYCSSNTFRDECYSNTFGNSCQFNTFGNGCNSNAFGVGCYSNAFGNNCYSNTFGYDCSYSTFGNNCYNSTFGHSCYSNTFGNNCYFNTFGNYCSYSTFGDSSTANTFGDSCQFNTFGNRCNSIRLQKSYIQGIIVENGNQYIDITSTQTTSDSNILKNITISQGVNNTTTRKTISHNTVNDAFKTTYQNSNSTTVNV